MILHRIKNKLLTLKKELINQYKSYLLDRYKKASLSPFDKTFFQGKRIALIGGADSAYMEKLGTYIDGFDIVVRVNKGVEAVAKYRDFIGGRTDLLVHCFYQGPAELGGSPITLELWEKSAVGKILYSHAIDMLPYGEHLDKFIADTKGKVKVNYLSAVQSELNFSVISPFHPTTGFIALNLIMDCQPKELYVTGITFFKTAHQKDYRDDNIAYWKQLLHDGKSKHNPDIEYAYAKELYRQFPNVFKPDETLKNIFETAR